MENTKKRGKKSLNGNGTSKTVRFRCSDELKKYCDDSGPDWMRLNLTRQMMKEKNGKNV